ncbi:unnamed protein product, partial [Discosporangium mesarthrocarpum]
QVAFQAAIAATGNLSFLNWLTALPAAFCFDDAHLAALFGATARAEAARAARARAGRKAGRGAEGGIIWGPPFFQRVGAWVRRGLNAFVAVVLMRGSVPAVQNMMSRGQAMNTSFDR